MLSLCMSMVCPILCEKKMYPLLCYRLQAITDFFIDGYGLDITEVEPSGENFSSLTNAIFSWLRIVSDTRSPSSPLCIHNAQNTSMNSICPEYCRWHFFSVLSKLDGSREKVLTMQKSVTRRNRTLSHSFYQFLPGFTYPFSLLVLVLCL